MCSYKGASEKGVKQHSRLKHGITQLDGQHEESEPKKLSELYAQKILVTAFVKNVMNIFLFKKK